MTKLTKAIVEPYIEVSNTGGGGTVCSLSIIYELHPYLILEIYMKN